MSSFTRVQAPSATIAAVALALTTLVGACELTAGHRMMFGLSLHVGDFSVSVETKAIDIKGE